MLLKIRVGEIIEYLDMNETCESNINDSETSDSDTESTESSHSTSVSDCLGNASKTNSKQKKTTSSPHINCILNSTRMPLLSSFSTLYISCMCKLNQGHSSDLNIVYLYFIHLCK